MQMFMSYGLHFATLGRDQAQTESLMLIFIRTPYTDEILIEIPMTFVRRQVDEDTIESRYEDADASVRLYIFIPDDFLEFSIRKPIRNKIIIASPCTYISNRKE
jgi:hypothetical protein